MSEKSDIEITLIRDEKAGRYAFNAKALQALGVDPAEARERVYPLNEPEECNVRLMCALPPIADISRTSRGIRH